MCPDPSAMEEHHCKVFIRFMYMKAVCLVVENSEGKLETKEPNEVSQFEMLMKAETILVQGLNLIQEKAPEDIEEKEKFSKMISKVSKLISKLGEDSLRSKKNNSSRLKNSDSRGKPDTGKDSQSIGRLVKASKDSRKSTPEGSNSSAFSRQNSAGRKIEIRSDRGLESSPIKGMKYSKFKKPPEPLLNQSKLPPRGDPRQYSSKKQNKSFKIHSSFNRTRINSSQPHDSEKEESEKKQMSPKRLHWAMNSSKRQLKWRQSLNLDKIAHREESVDRDLESHPPTNHHDKSKEVKHLNQEENKVMNISHLLKQMAAPRETHPPQIPAEKSKSAFSLHKHKSNSKTSIYEKVEEPKFIITAGKSNPVLTVNSNLPSKTSIKQNSKETSRKVSAIENFTGELEQESLSRHSSTINTPVIRDNSRHSSLATKSKGSLPFRRTKRTSSQATDELADHSKLLQKQRQHLIERSASQVLSGHQEVFDSSLPG